MRWVIIHFIKVSKINEHPIYAQWQENVIYSAAVKDKKLKFQQKEFSEERADEAHFVPNLYHF